jgi:hypothetical protein
MGDDPSILDEETNRDIQKMRFVLSFINKYREIKKKRRRKKAHGNSCDFYNIETISKEIKVLLFK